MSTRGPAPRPSLLSAISDAVPDGATFGRNGRAETGETRIRVFGPGGSLGRDVSRDVLNTALETVVHQGPLRARLIPLTAAESRRPLNLHAPGVYRGRSA